MSNSKQKSAFPSPIDIVAANKLDTTHRNPFAWSRNLCDIRTISYPDGISSVRFDLNEDAKHGLIRYDREFLLQFMAVCKNTPETLPPLESIGLLPNRDIPTTRGGSGRHRQGAPVPSCQEFVTLETSSGTAGSSNPFESGKSHITIPASKLTNEERFAKSNEKRFASSSELEPITSAGNTGVAHLPTVDEDSTSPEVVSRNVKALLNSLTMEKLDVISDRIIQWANISENEKDGRTLKLVIHLVVEKSTENTVQSAICINLCKRMMKNVSHRIQDITISIGRRKYMAGSQLFRRYLRDRCLSEIDRGWLREETAGEVSTAPQSTKDEHDAAVMSKLRSNEDGKDDPDKEADLPPSTNEDNPTRKAKRQCLSIIKFIGELFKQGVANERTIYKCLHKFLGPVYPDEEDVEALCMLLAAVGRQLDNLSSKARAKFDKYISRMEEWTRDPNVAQPLRNMLIEVIRLRERKWIGHPVNPARCKSDEIREITDMVQANGSNNQVIVAEGNALGTPSKAGELSTFGKISQLQSIIVDKKDIVEAQQQRLESSGHDEDGIDAVSGIITMRTPPEGDLKGDASNIQSRRQKSEEQTVVAFLERLVQIKMCSTALVPASEKHDTIKSIVNDLALKAPDALRKLSLMVKGGGLD